MKTPTIVVLAAVAAMAAPPGEVKVFKLATGEILAFPFEGGIPKTSESAWATCSSAGPAIKPEGDGFRLYWVVGLKSKGSALQDVVSVKLQEVSGNEAVTLFTGPMKADAYGLIINAPAELITRSTYPWLYSRDRTILVFRVELERPGEKPDVLIQPVLIGKDVKKQLQDKGYVR
jgi:hypothetical protein